MNNFVLRRYKASDKENIKELYELGSVHSEIGYRPGPWEHDFEDIENYYLKNGEFLVGFVGETMVAMGAYHKITDDIGHVRRMRVHPNYRRNGYAGEILTQLEKVAKEKGIKELRLRTSTQQKMAQNFYEKHGFNKMENQEKEFYTEGDGISFEVIWYRKPLE